MFKKRVNFLMQVDHSVLPFLGYVIEPLDLISDFLIVRFLIVAQLLALLLDFFDWFVLSIVNIPGIH